MLLVGAWAFSEWDASIGWHFRHREGSRRRMVRVKRAEQKALDAKLNELLCQGVVDWPAVVEVIQCGGAL